MPASQGSSGAEWVPGCVVRAKSLDFWAKKVAFLHYVKAIGLELRLGSSFCCF